MDGKRSQPSGLPQVSFYLRCYIGCWKYGWLSLIENNFRTLFCIYDFLSRQNKIFNRRKKLKIIQKKKLGLKKIFSSKIRHSDPRKKNVYEQNNNLILWMSKDVLNTIKSKRHGKLLSSKNVKWQIHSICTFFYIFKRSSLYQH